MYYEVELAGVAEATYPKYSFTVFGKQEGRYAGFINCLLTLFLFFFHSLIDALID